MESALSKNGAFNQGDISVLKEAVAILQHHDGVSGTAKQHVTDVLFNCHYNQFYDKQSRFNIPYVSESSKLLLRASSMLNEFVIIPNQF